MLTLERFAELRAAIERGDDRDAILGEAGLSREEWLKLQRHWLDEMADEIDGGSDALAIRYCRAFDAASGCAAEPGAPSAGSQEQAPVLEASVHTPSYLKPTADPTPGPAGPETGAVAAFDPSQRPVMPFREDAVPQIAAVASPASPPERIPTGTALAFEVPRGPATPFRPEPVAGDAASAPAARIGTGTAWAPSSPSGPATPFEPLDPEAHGFDLTRYAEVMAAIARAGGITPHVLSTFGLDAGTYEKIDAYWQRKLSGNGLLALRFGRLVEDATRALKQRAAQPIGTGTVLALDVPRTEAMASHTTPQVAGRAPEMNVEQYAWLVATLRRTAPADLPALLARVRLTPETQKDLEERWRQRMAADPAVQQAFVSALARHIAGGGG